MDRLVWIDCEMTGLDPETERLLEIAVVVTGPNLERALQLADVAKPASVPESGSGTPEKPQSSPDK